VKARANTEIKIREGGLLGGRGKFKAFGFLDTLKVHIQSNYLENTALSLLHTKLS